MDEGNFIAAAAEESRRHYAWTAEDGTDVITAASQEEPAVEYVGKGRLNRTEEKVGNRLNSMASLGYKD